MTALTAKRPQTDSKWLGNIQSYPVAASTTVYGGGLTMIDEAGYARPAGPRPGNKGVKGVAIDNVDNSSGAAGALWVDVQEGLFKFAGTTLLQAHVGRLVYAEDDQTVDAARGGLEPLAGVLLGYVSATEGWVAVGPPYYEEITEQGLDRVEEFEDFTGAAPTAHWTTHDTSAAGSPTQAVKADAADGAFEMAFDNTDEAQALALYWGDKTIIDPTKNPQIIFRLQTASLNANDILVFGLADARDATLDDNVSHAWFRIESGLDVLLESDDGTTDNDDKDPSVAITAATYYDFKIDMDDRTDVKFYYRASSDAAWTAMTVSGTTFSVGTAFLQPYTELQKSGGTQTTSMQVDSIRVSWDRT